VEIIIGDFIDNPEVRPKLDAGLQQGVMDLASMAGLRIETLRRVVVPDNFGASVLEFQELHGLIERGHTEWGESEAVGKTMYYIDSEELCQEIFIEKNLFGLLFVPEGDEHQMACHLVQHELAHVDDYHNKWEMLGAVGPPNCSESVEDRFALFSDIAWSEYYANRKTSCTASRLDTESIMGTLADLIYKVPIEVKGYIDEWQRHHDIDRLLKETDSIVSLLFRFMASLIGFRHGLGLDESPEREWVIEAGLERAHEQMEASLTRLFSEYPHWKGFGYDQLGTALHSIFKAFGLSFEDREEGVWVNVL